MLALRSFTISVLVISFWIASSSREPQPRSQGFLRQRRESRGSLKGTRRLAVAYATHVLDVYDHFAWRYTVKRLGSKVQTNR